jgi:hypothetical protein
MLLLMASGPVFGAVGYLIGWPILFWIGVALALVNLWMDGMSGVMKFLVLPLICVGVGAVALSPWWFGAGVGLLAWSALEAGRMMYASVRR